MSETENQDAANGGLSDAVAQAKPVDRDPEIRSGETYILMSTRTLAEIVKILRTLPFEDVELVMRDLKKVQPVKGKPAE